MPKKPGRRRAWTACAALVLAALVGAPASRAAGQDYLLYVVSEAADQVARVRFGGGAARVEVAIDTGIMPNDIDGPHGVAVSPNGLFYYVSLAHGQPFGSVLKYDTATNRVVGRVTLGLFPATIDVGPDGDFLYAVNFNLHGDMVPSSVSVVATGPMLEVARIRTCRMPHGSRINSAGTRHYSTCMMDDTLVEIDTGTLRVSRHFVVTAGREQGRNGAPAAADPLHAGHESAGAPRCSPTWAQPSADGRTVFVACNGSNEIAEIDAGSWTLVRRLPARPGVYNLAVTRSGRLVATNKRDRSVSVIDLASGREVAHLQTSRTIVHGVVVSPDDRYAFVTVEGLGVEPGSVEVVDLAALRVVARVDVAQQAAGITFWKMANEP